MAWKKFPFAARGSRSYRRHKPGEMNKTEARYADYLQVRLLAGEIEYWEFEPITFKIAKDLRYTPDYLVLTSNLTLEFHDVKAGIKQKRQGILTGKVVPRIEDDSRAKIIMCAEKWPFITFCSVWENAGNWERKIYGYAAVSE